MRLPQRLEAERASESDALAAYLDDPLKFFVPSRLMRGALLVLVDRAARRSRSSTGLPGWLVLFASGVAISIGVGQVLPALIVRRSPERVLELLLPAFTAVANIARAVTALIIGWVGRRRTRAERMADRRGRAVAAPTTATRGRRAGAAENAGCCARSSTSARRSCAKS